jgi:hypothetical protein
MDLHLFQTYGLSGLLIGGVLLLIYRLIDRGFTFRVPSRGRERKRRKTACGSIVYTRRDEASSSPPLRPTTRHWLWR